MLRNSGVASYAFAAVVTLVPLTESRADGMGSLKDAPAPSEEYVWDGLYVGVGIGVGSFDHSVDVDASKTKTKRICKYDPPSLTSLAFESSEQCWGTWEPVYGYPKTTSKSANFGDDEWNVFGTMQIGYDRLIHNHFLIGAFADLDFYQDAEESFSQKLYKPHSNKKFAEVSGGIELDHVVNVGGRLGFLVTPHILLYGVGGYSEASLDGSVNVKFAYGPSLALEAPDELQGYFIGGGAEVKLRKNVSLKVEYRYHDFDVEHSSASKTVGPYTYEKDCNLYEVSKSYKASADFDADMQSVRAVLVLKFDHPEHPGAALK